MDQNYIVRKGNNNFYIEHINNKIGEITFLVNKDGHLVVDHTFVDPNYRGQNLGMLLVNAVVEYAKEVNRKIIPLCPYVEKVFSRNSGYNDIWFK